MATGFPKTAGRFLYEDNLLVWENRDGTVIRYLNGYDETYGSLRYTGFEIGENAYRYLWDGEGRIAGITDAAGTEVARYQYSGLQVTAVLGPEEGEWVVKEEDDYAAEAWALLNRYHYHKALFGSTLGDIANPGQLQKTEESAGCMPSRILS